MGVMANFVPLWQTLQIFENYFYVVNKLCEMDYNVWEVLIY